MGCTEEQYIDVFQRKFVCKSQVTLSIKSLVYISNFVSGVTGTVDKYDFGLGMIDKQADKFACCISCSTNDSCFYHTSSSLWLA